MYILKHVHLKTCTSQNMNISKHVLKTCTSQNMYISKHVLKTCTQNMYISKHEHLKTCTSQNMYISKHVHLKTCTQNMYISKHVHLKTCTQNMHISKHVHLKTCTSQNVHLKTEAVVRRHETLFVKRRPFSRLKIFHSVLNNYHLPSMIFGYNLFAIWREW